MLPAVVSGEMLKGMWEMISGKQPANLSGPVGIAREMANAAEQGAVQFLHLMMLLSIYLGLFNLLPLPALDGGRVLFLGINALPIKQVSAKTEAAVHMVGPAAAAGRLRPGDLQGHQGHRRPDGELTRPGPARGRPAGTGRIHDGLVGERALVGERLPRRSRSCGGNTRRRSRPARGRPWRGSSTSSATRRPAGPAVRRGCWILGRRAPGAAGAAALVRRGSGRRSSWCRSIGCAAAPGVVVADLRHKGRPGGRVGARSTSSSPPTC